MRLLQLKSLFSKQKDNFTSTSFFNNIHIPALMANFKHDTIKYTNIKTCTYMYNPLILQHVSMFLRSLSETLHQTSIDERRMTYEIVKNSGLFDNSSVFHTCFFDANSLRMI